MVGQALSFWTDLLRLPDYEVVCFREESDLRRYRLTVAPKHRLGVCPHCKRASEDVHQTRTREGIKDLSISKYAVELDVRVLQFVCVRCEQAFTPAVPFLAEGAHATERFLERATELIRTSDVANAAGFLGVPERTLADWYYDYVQRRPNQNGRELKPVRHMGIDELSLKKNIGSLSP